MTVTLKSMVTAWSLRTEWEKGMYNSYFSSKSLITYYRVRNDSESQDLKWIKR